MSAWNCVCRIIPCRSRIWRKLPSKEHQVYPWPTETRIAYKWNTLKFPCEATIKFNGEITKTDYYFPSISTIEWTCTSLIVDFWQGLLHGKAGPNPPMVSQRRRNRRRPCATLEEFAAHMQHHQYQPLAFLISPNGAGAHILGPTGWSLFCSAVG